MKRSSSSETIRKVLHHIRRYRLLAGLSLLLAAVTVALTLYVPILLGRVIDAMVGAGEVDFAAIARLLTETAVLVGVSGLLQWLMNTVNNAITYQTVRDIRHEAFCHIERLPLSYLDAHPHGEIVSRVIADVDQFADGLLMGFTQLFTGVLTVLGTLVFMLTLHVGITLVVVVLTPLSLLVARFIARRTYALFHRQSEIRGEQTALVNERIGGVKTVQAFSQEEASLERFDEINDRLERCSVRAVFFSSLVNPSTRFLNALVYAAVALTGALTVIRPDSALTVGGLACFLSYATQYSRPFNEISGVVAELQNALACAARIFDLMEQPPQTPDAPDAVRLEQVDGQVTLDGVAFSYLPDRPLIENLNLRVQPGQRVALVGPTGCGKTTVINLLMRFYDVNAGAITVDGHDVRQVTRHSLRASYGMVLQETWLKAGTVRENLCMGRPDATEDEMIAAARDAHAHEFITRLPQGYDTVLEEDGGSLSQGQKQLLCIARVMLCRPPMLILDEATSSIDTRTELKIQEAFARMMQGHTSFIVAHRLSTVREADVILVMRDGHIVEQGTHAGLLARDGFYAHLYNSQFAP